MSISAPAFAPRSDRSSPKNSTCPLRVSSSCSAILLLVPNQGATIASETIQITAIPLRKAAAQARHFLMARAAERLELAAGELSVEDGLIRGRDNRSVSYGELIGDEIIRLELADDVPVKAASAYTIVGQSVPRVDLPAKATGELVYVHDVRVPGMLHGRVVRPPYAGVDAGPFVGTSLIAVDEASVGDIPGLVAVVRIGDFVGVIAEREENAIKAAAQLRVTWKPTPTIPDLKDVETALRANPSTPRTLIDKGDVDTAIAAAAKPMARTYVWPYQMHGSIGPSCAVADYQDGRIRVWSGTQNPHILRADLALLLQRPETEIDVIRMEAAGCYGRNCADDVSADAVLLSRAVGRPVRVQLTREQEHAWEPKGTAQLMDVKGGLNADGGVAGYDFATRYPSNGAPTLALLLTGAVAPVAAVFEMGDRTAIPPYDYDAMRVVAHDMPPIVRASWLRGVSALPNTFAHESYIDELATEAGVDPIDYRLRYLRDPRAIDLDQRRRRARRLDAASAPAGAGSRRRHRARARLCLRALRPQPVSGLRRGVVGLDCRRRRQQGDRRRQRDPRRGRPGFRPDDQSGRRPPPDPRQRHPVDQPRADGRGFVRPQRGDEPRMGRLSDHQIPRCSQDRRPDAATAGTAAARRRRVRVGPERRGDRQRHLRCDRRAFSRIAVHAGAHSGGIARRRSARCAERVAAGRAPTAGLARHVEKSVSPGGAARSRRSRRYVQRRSASPSAVLPWRAIAPIARPDASIYSEATIARGRQLAALGDCAVCHTVANGAINAGGRAIETPFGVIYATNITPDVETGIGSWSYPAFERAMREGIHRDGRHLYPAFPYTHFARATDADLQALYAYLMAQPRGARRKPKPRSRFRSICVR